MDSYECVVCSASFRTNTLLRAHSLREHELNLHGYCPVCLTFRETTGLTLVHQKASNHNACCLCYGEFQSFDLLLSHFIEEHIAQGTEETEKRFYCTECYVDYPTWDALLEHVHLSHLNIWLVLFE
ncbi:zinc finger C2H2 type [Echinococcus multilocularis]|uniref:Zinc finger C2H2 type n=1 Tax=Echinococcus multilocularis TaxID=6211 RepID=U6HT88_ECHMU|nr:zinc finger C2H2 type [Echinococcus multilocularis]CDS39884.1 zinc finger C2H2 type [Echinococcus multilocularis]